MITKTRGIVFRRIPYSESSIITDIYTEQHGLMSYIIGGVRKARPKTSASLLQVMSIVEILAYHTDKNKLHRIKEIKPAYVYQSMPMDVRKNAILMFLAELCSRAIKETEENPPLFDMIMQELIRLDKAESGYSDLHLEFMVKLADELGFGPSPNYSSQTPCFDMVGGEFVATLPQNHMHYIEDGSDIFRLINQARGDGPDARFDRQKRNRLIEYLVLYFRIHIENMKEIRSHLILREVL
jgi:DNA repair protein RecO (recombination protein O)